MANINKLIFDSWNRKHIARHNVIPEEVEEVCLNKPITSLTYARRIRLIGKSSNSRTLTIILAAKGEGSYYVVTARPASRKERLKYQKTKGGEIND